MAWIQWKFLGRAATWLTLGITDETRYIESGLAVRPSVDWSPIYSMYYWLIGHFSQIPETLYAANFIAMTILPSWGTWFVLHRHKKNTATCLVGAFWVLILPALVSEDVKVGHFNVLAAFSLLILVRTLTTNSAKQCFGIGLGFLWLTYLRQENLIGGLILIPLGLFFLKKSRTKGFLIAGAVVSLSILAIMHWNPFSNRIWDAFYDHFNHRGWLAGEGDRAMLAFGDSTSFSQAIITNPSAIIDHVIENFQIWLRMIGRFFPLNPSVWDFRNQSSGPWLTIVTLATLLMVRLRERQVSSRLNMNTPPFGLILPFQEFALCMILSPWRKYMVATMLSIIIATLTIIGPRRRSLALTGVVIASALWVTPPTDSLKYPRSTFFLGARPAIAYLEEHPELKTKRVLAGPAFSSKSIMSIDARLWVRGESSEGLTLITFDHMLKKHMPELIVLDRHWPILTPNHQIWPSARVGVVITHLEQSNCYKKIAHTPDYFIFLKEGGCTLGQMFRQHTLTH